MLGESDDQVTASGSDSLRRIPEALGLQLATKRKHRMQNLPLQVVRALIIVQ